MLMPLRLLMVEDSENDAILLLHELRRCGWEVTHTQVQTAAAMTAALIDESWDIIISDYSMPQFSGVAALALARKFAPALPFILISGTVGEEVAVEAMKAGANDYLFKGNLKRLGPAVQRELRDAQTRQEAQRVSAELHTRERQLADAQRLARLGSWHIDVATNLTALSDESFRILGRPIQTAGIPFGEFLACFHPEDRTLVAGILAAPDIKQFARDIRIARHDGLPCFVHLRGDIVRDSGGKPLHAAGMIQDITERKLVEQELQQAYDEIAVAKNAAESAGRAKDHFLAILSHELRTPLTPVLALASHLEKRRDLPDNLRDDLGVIRRNVAMEARLIDDLLDLTRIVSNKLELHFDVVNVHDVLRAGLDVFREDVKQKNMEMQLELHAPEHHAWADPSRLQQIFMNLISNALKFTPPGGRILLSSNNDNRGHLLIHVQDTGIGIEASVLPRVFNSFEQGERTVNRRYGGLGMGLSIVKSLVELHGGQIHVMSEGIDKGATFTVEFTAISAGADGSKSDKLPPSSIVPVTSRIRRVLLVEDHEDTRRVMTRLLESNGCVVTNASTVAQAIALADGGEFDLLVSDIGLPDGTGLDVMKHIRSRRQLRGIAVSGFGQAEDVRRSREAGFDAHLTKPVDFDAFMSVVQSTST
jgi:signal transduction histidine kinase